MEGNYLHNNRANILKTLQTPEITPNQLAAIANYTRGEPNLENLFVFSLVLCDNEIDRDFERFPKESLQTLSSLFVGKTGVFDHNAKAENQSARIFETTVVEDGSLNSLGEPYCALKAWAYMVRCDKNSDLILEIDAGIKKEISIGCAVAKKTCSVCGKEVQKQHCEHQKGEIYYEKICHHLLLQPTDAYEWSFVAVPAQKQAGVVKQFGISTQNEPVLKRLAQGSETTFNSQETKFLHNYLEQLSSLAKHGQEYQQILQKNIVRLSALTFPDLDSSVMESVVSAMDLKQLQEFQHSLEQSQKKKLATPQLLSQSEPNNNNPSFYI